MTGEAQQSELVLVNQMSKEELADMISEIIRENGNVRQAIINLVCACPNIVTEI